MKIYFQYSLKWRYEFNNSKSGVVSFGETKSTHFKSIQDRKWFLGESSVDELYEYKNLGVTKNYVGSFSSNVEDNIEKTRKKAGMLFSANINRLRTSPLVYVKFWRQACLPALLFGSELFTLTSSQLLQLERCQSWFLRITFYAPKFVPRVLLLKLSNLNSVEAEGDIKKLLFLGRLITQANMAKTVKSLFLVRVENYFDSRFSSLGAIPSICETLCKYDLFQLFEN